MAEKFRSESDSMGEVRLPAGALWGAQTQRAVENFSISPLRIHPSLVRALGLIKKHAAKTNLFLGLISEEASGAIVIVADTLIHGEGLDEFPVDVFQTGSGTSWNMNINEVIANKANLSLGSNLGSRTPVHPNDHVNKGQSSNDVIPAALNIANRLELIQTLEGLKILEEALSLKAREFKDVIKLGRTHLQDAVPMTLGQEFSVFACQVRRTWKHLAGMERELEALPLGGTAVGTGLNAHPDFAHHTIAGIAGETGVGFYPMENKFQGIATRSIQVDLMGGINTLATDLIKIANDLRLLSSGPRAGFGEIILPALQPGSSIMPGKVNPVIPEMVIQAAAHLQGKALSVSIANQHGPLQLNMMMPLISHETLTALELLGRTALVLTEKCIRGIEADEERCLGALERSLALVTPVAVRIGYDKAAALAHHAFIEGRTIREVLYESALLSREEIDTLLDPQGMI